MKKILCVLPLYFLVFGLMAFDDSTKTRPGEITITGGFLNGGGSLLGIDVEAFLTKKIGLQAGMGLVGFGAGVNYHLKPAVNSSFVSWQYWHQGIGNSYTQSVMGPNFVFRAKKIFTAQIGLGYVLETGQALEKHLESRNKSIKDYPPVILMYSVGIYFINK